MAIRLPENIAGVKVGLLSLLPKPPPGQCSDVQQTDTFRMKITEKKHLNVQGLKKVQACKSLKGLHVPASVLHWLLGSWLLHHDQHGCWCSEISIVQCEGSVLRRHAVVTLDEHSGPPPLPTPQGLGRASPHSPPPCPPLQHQPSFYPQRGLAF